MYKRALLTTLSVAVAAAGAVWAVLARDPARAVRPETAPAIPVGIATVERRDMPVYLEGLGAVQAFNMVTIRTQVDGELVQVLFHEGQDVRKGDLLARIDPRPFQAAYDQAVARKAADQAQLANARLDEARYAGLVGRQYISRQQLDTARAQVAQLAATVAGDQAAIESARVNLVYTRITSPLDGRTGIRLVDQGNIVHPGDASGLVVVTQLQPISVIFTLPEDAVTPILKAMRGHRLAVDTLSRDDRERLDHGELVLVDNQIDPATGMVKLRATMPNKAGLLWPGEFINGRLLVERHLQVPTVPATAVLNGQQGRYVWVVRGDGTVISRSVTVGPGADDLVEILSGVSPGEKVVFSGQYRLRTGARVAALAAPSEGGAVK